MKLYHGTNNNRARNIITEGFRRAKSASYTGTGVNFSEHMSTSYEYGSYENGGCVLVAGVSNKATIINLGMGE
jgi:hypothetical protein